MKPFIKEINGFDDLFQGMENFSDIIKFASSQLNSDDLEAFQTYRNKILERIPLDLLTIEYVNRPTPNISLDNETKDMYEDESGQSEHQSHNSDHSENESESRNDSTKKIINQVMQEIEMQEKNKVME